ncbi:peptidase domain-containing ABC transporter [Rufibacter quisquiliarum]|uniref:ABC-type bacteriocin/lantibiotic exporter with double-glycine peptidase domain n=1 Tax=Rufibacter quisquiliarum TaxID=1549639 RepID=A0A839GI66_9BACT|nr:ABC transporter ATP-binding protein [Rufibacter quisquiliarum]MBA9075315.1 ABC-type bacteriocin/lantibiotic exporter with double-glycine peptidase domain [Rufibacter quisquiliarum]
MKRFLMLLASERKIIGYIYIYALFSGLVSLSLPLGIQSLIGFVSGGQLVTSVSVLIFFIVLGVLVVGGLQVMQLSLVETIQQRIFATKAFQFVTKLTTLEGRQLAVQDLPEMMNRFFDVISLQKGLAKMLTDFSAAAIQIVFGLVLLSFYHPYFIIFGLLLIAILVLILRVTGPKGMSTSLEESKYKYKLVHWLEEVARSITVFKSASHEKLSLQKTDKYTSGYLKAREAHFKVLIAQYIGFVGFKTIITASLLLMGSLLLVNQEINLGQFVASEIIIILIINAVEKLLVKLDVVYDVLTSLEKLGAVTDLPSEEKKELSTGNPTIQQGISLQTKALSYQYAGLKRTALQEVELTVAPGEKVCLAGGEQAGRSTLLQVLAGILPAYEGVVVYNGLSLREYDPEVLHGQMGLFLLPAPPFAGSILENITLGQPEVTLEKVLWALECVELSDFVQGLPDGLQTMVRSHAPDIPESITQRLALARSIVRRPNLLLLDHFLPDVSQRQRQRIAQRLLAASMPWTVVVISNDPAIMQQCSRVVLLQHGRLTRDLTKEEISNGQLENIL